MSLNKAINSQIESKYNSEPNITVSKKKRFKKERLTTIKH